MLSLRCLALVLVMAALALGAASRSLADTVEAGQAAFEQGDFQGAYQAWAAAAAAGDRDAQYALGAMYSRGRGVARDQDKANQWYLAAARAGQVEAQYRIGMRYRTGDGLPRDFEQAYAWLKLAASSGHRKATAAAKRIGQKLTAEQRSAALRSRSLEPRVAQDSPLSEQRALIRNIQTHLLLLGYDAGAVDGFAGGQTKGALRAFQRRSGLPADGKMTYAALDALKAALAGERAKGTPGG